MKFRTTKKAIMNGYDTVICIGYCDLQHLLNYESPVAYTARREGWGADIYDFGGTAIVTGYAPFGTIRPKYELVREYEDKAKHILYSRCDYDYADLRSMLDELIAEFIKVVKERT